MTNGITLLDRYHQLVQSHSAEFEPQIHQLEQQVQTEITRLREQEAVLVESQTSALADLKLAIETDACFLVKTPAFKSFVDQLPPQESQSWRTKLSIQLSLDPLEWSLNQAEQPLKISDYEMTIDPDDYDDENTHTSFGYSVQVELGSLSTEIERILFKRVYASRQYHYSQRDQLEEIESYLEDLWEEKTMSLQDQILLAEVSYVVLYAVSLLALEPQRVNFTYDSTPSHPDEED
jgi:hypothetical protein